MGSVAAYVLTGVMAFAFLAAAIAVVVVGGRFTRRVTEPRERAIRWLAIGLVAAILLLWGLGVAGIASASSFYSMSVLLMFGVAGLYWVDQLLDCLTAPPRQDDERVIWTLAILLTFVIGAFLYQVVGKERIRAARHDSGELNRDS